VGAGLPADQLSQVGAVDCPAHRHCGRIGDFADDPRTRRLAALEPHAPRTYRRNGVVSNGHHANAVISGIHVWPAAGGNPDSGRPADAANHCHNPAAQQRRPLQRRPVRLHIGVRRRCAQPADSGRARTRRYGHGRARRRVHRRLPVPDRLCGAPAAAGRRRRSGPRCLRRRLRCTKGSVRPAVWSNTATHRKSCSRSRFPRCWRWRGSTTA